LIENRCFINKNGGSRYFVAKLKRVNGYVGKNKRGSANIKWE